jgi:hypothetical protein
VSAIVSGEHDLSTDGKIPWIVLQQVVEEVACCDCGQPLVVVGWGNKNIFFYASHWNAYGNMNSVSARNTQRLEDPRYYLHHVVPVVVQRFCLELLTTYRSS